MKVQNIQHNTIKKQEQPQFKGLGDNFLRYLATNQALGANSVDVAFMVLPRTITDFVGRGPDAGLETARREASGTANHTFVGAYGILSGLVAAALMGINKDFGADVNKIFTSPETLNILAEFKTKQFKDGKTQVEYLKEILSNIKACNPDAKGADADGLVKLPAKVIEEVAALLDKNLEKNIKFADWNNKKSSDSLQVALNKIVEATGADSKYILEFDKNKSESTLKTLLEDIYKVSESFNKKKVVDAFKTQVQENKGVKENAYVKKLARFMKARSYAGFGIATAIGMSIQPINIYLTKKKTGSDGFVGVEGRSKDNSTGFKALKGVSAVAFFGMVLKTLETGLGGFMKKMSFTGFWPTTDQLKGIYGLTIISRILATRDKDELRESVTKDFLGFLSWLVLGNLVNRVTAEKLDNTVMNRTKNVAEKGFWSRAFNSSLKTRDEILIETLAKNGIATVKKEGDKNIAKTFGEMMKDLKNLSPEIQKVAKKRLRTLNWAQLAGYAFSGLVLGLGIPNLNIYITNKLDKKRKAQQAEKEAQQLQLAKA